MNIGCHGSVWTGAFDVDGVRLAVSKTREAGFDLIEIPLMDPEGLDVAATRRVLEEYHLAATASLGLRDDIDISSEDMDIVANGEQHLRTCLEVLSEVGGTHLVGVIYCAMKKYFSPASDLGRQHSVDTIGRLATRAEELGVRLGIEVVNRYESNLVNTSRQAVEYVKQVGHDNVSVHLDTYHMNIEEADPPQALVAAGPWIRHIQVSDSNRLEPGSGHIDWVATLQAIASIGYSGELAYECRLSGPVDEVLATSVRRIREAARA